MIPGGYCHMMGDERKIILYYQLLIVFFHLTKGDNWVMKTHIY